MMLFSFILFYLLPTIITLIFVRIAISAEIIKREDYGIATFAVFCPIVNVIATIIFVGAFLFGVLEWIVTGE